MERSQYLINQRACVYLSQFELSGRLESYISPTVTDDAT